VAQPPPTTTPAETPGVVIGNLTPKYTARNPAIRWLTQRWVANLDQQLARIAAQGAAGAALEVGCGEGVIAAKLHQRFGEVVALDLPDAGLRAHWRQRPGPRFLHADAHALPFGDDRFGWWSPPRSSSTCPTPPGGSRSWPGWAGRHLVLSVPQEPLFRACNLLAGRYVGALGNTPGHLNHWTRRGFVRFVAGVAEVREVTSPFPWTTVWATLPRA